MPKMELKAQELLDMMAVPNHVNVYFVGARARRVSFWAQQNRALNLVWALRESGKLDNNEECAVVGGGLAGMTTAAALITEGADVTLFERRHKLMHLQQENFQRYLHPRLAEWPERGSVQRFAELPCLQWHDGMANKVVDEIWQQWIGLRDSVNKSRMYPYPGLQEHSGLEVLNIAYFEDEKPIVRYRDDKDNVHEKTFALVVVAIGFGLELNQSVSRSVSYWDNDNLTRPVLKGPIPRSYLVTGAGDGGLIDAVRLRLDGCRHDSLAWTVSGIQIRDLVDNQNSEHHLSLFRQQLELERRLLDIEERARKIGVGDDLGNEFQRRLEFHAVEEWDALLRARIRDDLQSDFLFHEYDKLVSSPLISGVSDQDNLLKRLEKFITDSQRLDTKVTLNQPTSSPMTLRSSIINRFTAFLFMKFGNLRTVSGRMEAREQAGGKVSVTFERSRFKQQMNEEFDEVVVRHGPESPLIPLFGEKIASRLSADMTDDKDIMFESSGEPQYDSDFSYGVRQCMRLSRPEDFEYLRLRNLKIPCESILKNELVRRILEVFPDTAGHLRCCVWVSSIVEAGLMFMATRYFPIRSRARRMPFILTFKSSKGIIGKAFMTREPSAATRIPGESDLDYELSLVTDWHFSTMEAAHLHKQIQSLFAFPLVQGTECVGVIYGDFRTTTPLEDKGVQILQLCAGVQSDMIMAIEGASVVV